MDDGRRCLTSHIDTSPELCSRASGDTFQFFTHHRRGHRSARWNWKSRGRGNGATGYGVGDVAEHQQQHDHEGRKIPLKELNQKQARPRIVSGRWKWTHVSHLAPAPNRFEVHLPQYVSNITRLSMHIVNTPGIPNRFTTILLLHTEYQTVLLHAQMCMHMSQMCMCMCMCMYMCKCMSCACACACHVIL